jgi:hypothetical protein
LRGPINLKFEDHAEEAIEAMNAVFALSAIRGAAGGREVREGGTDFRRRSCRAHGRPIRTRTSSRSWVFVTKLVKVTKIKPGDIAQAVQQFASSKVQNPCFSTTRISSSSATWRPT